MPGYWRDPGPTRSRHAPLSGRRGQWQALLGTAVSAVERDMATYPNCTPSCGNFQGAASRRIACITVFPVPPLQQLGIGLGLRCEIDSASKYVENAPIHVPAHFPTEFGVKGLRVSVSEFRNISDPEKTKIRGNRRSNAGDLRQLGDRGPGRRPPSHFPCVDGFDRRRRSTASSVSR
jgi:hypothetical protein